MLGYLPKAEPTTRNKIINTLIGHLKTQAGYIPQLSGEIAVIDHGAVPTCPEGITFIFPVGAIVLAPPDWNPEFAYEFLDNGEMKVTLLNPAKIMLLCPDLIYRIDPDNHIIGAGMTARDTAAYLNKVYCTEQEEGKETGNDSIDT